LQAGLTGPRRVQIAFNHRSIDFPLQLILKQARAVKLRIGLERTQGDSFKWHRAVSKEMDFAWPTQPTVLSIEFSAFARRLSRSGFHALAMPTSAAAMDVSALRSR
jgi:hypothetical protein